MSLFLSLLFLLIISPKPSATISIGSIRNAWWNQSATQIQNWNISCIECICTMMMASPSLVGFNCLLTNQICYFFANYSNDSSAMQSYPNSTFYCRVLPPTSTSASSTVVVNQIHSRKIRSITKADR